LVARQREFFKTKDLLAEHTKEVNSVQFSHDGNLLLTAGEDGRAIIWHVSDQKLVCILGSCSEVLWTAAFNPDSARAATGGNDGMVNIWDLPASLTNE